MINITFGPAINKTKKTWMFAVTEDLHLEGISLKLQYMIQSAYTLNKDFTLEALAVKAHEMGMECTTKGDNEVDFNAIGYTHRPKLIEMGIIKEA